MKFTLSTNDKFESHDYWPENQGQPYTPDGK